MNAARVARTFRMDPLVVLAGHEAAVRCPFPMAWAVRIACRDVVLADESPKDKPIDGSGVDL